MPKNQKVYINGINAVTGEYLVRPMTRNQLARYIAGEPDRDLLRWLTRMLQLMAVPSLALDRDPTNLKEVGWAVVFHEKESSEVKKALEPLVAHRRKQVGSNKLVKTLEYRDNESTQEFLGRYQLAPGSKDPEKIPQYLLLVGSPERIPFLISHLLDIEYSVGRLDFDRPDDYAAYVESLIAYETGAAVPNSRRALFFGTRHPFDKATQMSTDLLVTPLVNGTPGAGAELPKLGVAQEFGFQSSLVLGEAATKAALTGALAAPEGGKLPALLFTASHGVGFPSGHADQLDRQGALLCGDWPGFGHISPAHYFSAADLPAGIRLDGLVAFHFACYGAGTPETDRFLKIPGKKPPQIAPKPFTAALPKTLLLQGALAVVGHVERAWGYSIATDQAGPQIQPFRNTIGRILFGQPVGFSTMDFNQRYAWLSANLTAMIDTKSAGGNVSDQELASSWIERNDAEGYVVLGDPAVRLRVKDLI